MHVVKSSTVDYSGSPYWKIIVDIPQLHLETPDLFTQEHANELIDEIARLDD